MATPLDQMIEELEAQKQVIDDALLKFKNARNSLEDLPRQISDKFKSMTPTIPIQGTNYQKVIHYLKSQNGWKTFEEIADGLGIPKASVAGVIYNKSSRREFESKRMGDGKLLGWKLKNS